MLAKDIQKKWEQTLGKFAAKQDKNTYPGRFRLPSPSSIWLVKLGLKITRTALAGKDYLLEVAEKTRDSVVKSLIDRLTSEVRICWNLDQALATAFALIRALPTTLCD